MSGPSRHRASVSHPEIGGVPLDENAAAVVAEAVAIAADAQATETASAVAQIAAAVAAAADHATRAARRAKGARTVGAKQAAAAIACEAVETALEVQSRADAAALQVAHAATLVAEDLLAFGSQSRRTKGPVRAADTVLAAAEATKEETARAAEAVATGVAHAAARITAVTAASDDDFEDEPGVSAARSKEVTPAQTRQEAADAQPAGGVAVGAPAAASALGETTSLEIAAHHLRSSPGGQVGTATQGAPARTSLPVVADERTDAEYATFNGTLFALSGLALNDASPDLTVLLSSVAHFAAAANPDADSVGLTWFDEGRVDVVVATSDEAYEITVLDHRHDGPGASAAEAAKTTLFNSASTDTSWPNFPRVAATRGVRSAVCVPLIVENVLGTMAFYSQVADGFDARSVELAEEFAKAAAPFLQNAQVLFTSQRLVADLRAALKTRAVIDQAIGIMMSRSGYTPQEAFNGLKSVSQTQNRKLHLVAERLVREAVRRAQVRARNSGHS